MSEVESKAPVTVQVDVEFLQAILDYLKTKPYEEVHQFVSALTTPRQSQSQSRIDSNETPQGFDSNETPQGFDSNKSNSDQ